MDPMVELTPLAHRTEQALKRFPVGRTTLYALAKTGRICPIHVGRVTLWPESELRRLVEELATEADGNRTDGAALMPASTQRESEGLISPGLADRFAGKHLERPPR